jgi:diguanylate cyclase (GGDEF)-like protein
MAVVAGNPSRFEGVSPAMLFKGATMSGQETRVTRIASLEERAAADSESCLVVIHGPNLGKNYVLDAEEFTIGRDMKNNIVVDLDNVSRRHAIIRTRQGRSYVQDLGSTNGTYLNDQEALEEALLRSGDFVKVGGAIFKFLSGGNIEKLYHEEIYQLTITDGLTQTYNKRYLMEFLEREIGRCLRYKRALSLIMIDVDHFKKVNDTQGHIAGDVVLRELAQRIKQRIRKEECFARYGGEEFAVVIPESGPVKARRFAEKLRKLVADEPFAFEGKEMNITISLGVADMGSDITEPAEFIKVADSHLYKAKEAGRNQVAG